MTKTYKKIGAWEMDQWVKLYKNEDLIWIPSTHVQWQAWWLTPVTSALWSRAEIEEDLICQRG